jgi:formylglycine-generating enzyme required for sulfatase activity/serine/threonine protein kinase
VLRPWRTHHWSGALDQEHRNALPTGHEIEGYRVEGILGAGGFGITYLATELALGRKVAIKEYLPAGLAVRATEDMSVRPVSQGSMKDYYWGLERFRQEAETLVNFHHPNIVGVHRFFEANSTAYLVMQFVEGRSLDQILNEQRSLPEAEILRFLPPILDGLEQVHRAGFLHRDVKPANIYIKTDGTPVLLDFSAARQTVELSNAGMTAIVSDGYAPYEQYGSGGTLGPWTDIYGLGAVLYRCVTGQRPVQAPDRLSAVVNNQRDPLPPPAVVARGTFAPALLDGIVAALSVFERDRPQTVAQLRAIFNRETGDRPSSSRARKNGASGPSKTPSGPSAGLPAGLAAAQDGRDAISALRRAEAVKSERRRGGFITVVAIGAVIVMVGAAGFVLGFRGGNADSPGRGVKTERKAAVGQPSGEPGKAAPARPVETAGAGPSGSAESAKPAPTPPPAANPPAAPPPAAQPQPPAAQPPAAPPKPESVGRLPETAAPKPPPVVVRGFKDCPECPELVLVPAGRGKIGAGEAEKTRETDDLPVRVVTISRPFAMGRYEVTRDEFAAFVEATGHRAEGGCYSWSESRWVLNPERSWRNPGFPQTGRDPAVCINFRDAQAYVRWLSSRTGKRYRIPTESEWEYAARAGTETSRPWGEDPADACDHANGTDLAALRRPNANEFDYHDCDDGHIYTAPAGSFRPNAFGLHDMIGNAWEWTVDCWTEGPPARAANGRAAPPEDCNRRAVRGGAWNYTPPYLRSAARLKGAVGVRIYNIGFRVVRDSD